MALLEMRNIDKYFFGKPANDHVCLEVSKGEIHALLGENGAGKTTLMNILYGLYARDGGEIIYEGREVNFHSPREAIKHHIGMVHQHFTLVPTLTVSQNITLGLKSSGHPFPDRKKINETISALSARYGLDVEPNACVKDLSVGMQQRVEIIKLLYRDAKLLILDEPTAVLTPHETEGLFAVLRKLRQEGQGVIIITHRIAEVMGYSDKVSILRNGKNAASFTTSSTSAGELSRYMIGREISEIECPRLSSDSGAVTDGLRLKGLGVFNRDRRILGPLDLWVPPGTILGIAGVDGNGQKELAETIMGIRACQEGSITLDGEDLGALSTAERRKRGMGYISDDRHRDSLILDMDLMDNLLLKMYNEEGTVQHGLINRERIRTGADTIVKTHQIKISSLENSVRYLSGGNQQKLILAREMAGCPRLIIASQPARGLDIGASEFVRRQLVEHRDSGCSVLLVSSDLDEILMLSDTIAVMHHGVIMGLLKRGEVDMTALGLLMAGIAPAPETAE
jgi:simple sugar transport system ATP-binding protein